MDMGFFLKKIGTIKFSRKLESLMKLDVNETLILHWHETTRLLNGLRDHF
jgi:hypothetical protein